MNYWNNQQAKNLNGIELKNLLSKKRIIKYLYRKQELTATDISKIFHLSLPTTLSLLKEILDEGLIEDRGKGNSMGGRRPNVYGIKDDAVYIVGIDLRLKAPSIAIFNGKMEKVAGLPIRF
jgi:DNA-binding transcriptional ArsR family regulator